jgi:predicted flap endonuclease-1-like 5' DNA nuclease
MRVPQVSERIKEAPAQALRGVFAGIGQLLLITDKLRNKASHQDVPHARTPEASETVTDTSVTSPAGLGAATAPVGAAAAAAPAAAAPSAAAAAAAPVEAAAEGEAIAAEPAPVKPAARARRAAATPVTDKPVTAKPPAKPATAKPTTPRRTAAKAAATEAAESAGETAPKPPKRQSARNFDKTGNVRVLGDEASPAASATPAAAAAAPEPAPTPEPAAAAEPAAVAEPTAAAAPLPNYDELSVASLRARLRNLDVAQVRQLAEYERAHAARADVLTMFERRIAKLEAEA